MTTKLVHGSNLAQNALLRDPSCVTAPTQGKDPFQLDAAPAGGTVGWGFVQVNTGVLTLPTAEKNF